MITKQSNLDIITQVAKLFFPTDTLSQSVVYERIKTYLTDDLFTSILGNLSNGRFYIFNTTGIIPQVPRPGYVPRFNIKNHFVDLFLGESGNGQINDVPANKMNDKPAIYNQVGLTYLASITVNAVIYDIVHNQSIQSYGITYSPVINTGGNTGGETGGIRVDPVYNETINTGSTKQPTTSAQNFLGMDLNSLIIPGLLVVAFLMMKK